MNSYVFEVKMQEIAMEEQRKKEAMQQQAQTGIQQEVKPEDIKSEEDAKKFAMQFHQQQSGGVAQQGEPKNSEQKPTQKSREPVKDLRKAITERLRNVY